MIQLMRFVITCNVKAVNFSCEHLPPCAEVLELHAMRANYQARIWRESLVQFQSEVNPEDHGWFVDESNDQLDIKWMRCNPAPDEV